MKIKVCGLSEKANISEVINLSPDYLGFIFYPPSPRYVKGKLKPEFLNHPDIKLCKTGVFVNESVEKILEIKEEYSLDRIQLHGDESPDYCNRLAEKGVSIIKAFSISEGFDFSSLKPYQQSCPCFLFDTPAKERGGSGRKFDWEELSAYKLDTPFLLSGGIGPGDAEKITAVKHPMMTGVDLNSRFEMSPGIKDIEKLKEFIKQIR